MARFVDRDSTTDEGCWILPADPTYWELLEFFNREAELLDARRFVEWLGMLAMDIEYLMPVPLNRHPRNGDLAAARSAIFHENYSSLRVRIDRLATHFAWAEDPPSRTRHLVSNIRLRTINSTELDAMTTFVVYRNRAGRSESDVLTGERADRLRKVDGGWRLYRRKITLDQAIPEIRSLSFFI